MSDQGSGAPARRLMALFGEVPFEVRFSLTGRAAVRVEASRGAVAPRHAECVRPQAPWVVTARCGSARGWLLAAHAPRGEPEAQDLLQRFVDRRTAVLLERHAAHSAAVTASLLERLTHSLRTDVAALQAVAEGLARGVFDTADRRRIPEEVAGVGQAAQRRLTDATEVMSVLQDVGADPCSGEAVEETLQVELDRAGGGPATAPTPGEAIEDPLRTELDGAGVGVVIDGVGGERAMTSLSGTGWAACARILVEALARDERLGGNRARITVRPHPDGWAVTAGQRAAAGTRPVPWSESAVGALVVAGQIVVAGGGWASAAGGAGRLEVELVLPAAPSR